MMAYSSIGHMGYALIGLAAAGVVDDISARNHGIQAMLVYLGIYIFMNVGTFSCILLMKREGRMVEGIDDLAGLSKTSPGLAIIFSVFMSEFDTKSDGPFLETCNFSSSPKSLISIFEAFSLALIMTFKFGDIEFIN